MDYGKLAYLKTEDLERQVNNLRAQIETAPYNCLSVLNKRPDYFEKSFQIEDYIITAKKQTTLTLQYKVLLASGSNESFDFTLLINNIRVEVFTDYIGLEPKSFTFTVVVEGLPKGDNIVAAVIDFANSGQYTILCAEINAMGNNIFETAKTINVSVLNKTLGTIIAVSKPEEGYIRFIDQYINYDYLGAPYLNFRKLGREYALSNMYYQSTGAEIYETTLYAYVNNEKQLVINSMNVFSGVIVDSIIVDSDVDCVSACPCLNPAGASLTYIKNNAVYTSNITTDGSTLNFSVPKLFKTIYGRIKTAVVFTDANNRTNLFFATNLNNGYLKLADSNNNGNDFSEMFRDKTVGLGKCENIRFQPLSDKLIIFIKFKGAVYERVLQDNTLSEPVLAAFCDELIPLNNRYIARKNNRLNII